MAQKDVGNKVPIYKLKKTEEVMKYYDEWGKGNKYDKDMVDWNYTGPKETSEVFIKHNDNKDAKIYDAGCGTSPEELGILVCSIASALQILWVLQLEIGNGGTRRLLQLCRCYGWCHTALDKVGS